MSESQFEEIKPDLDDMFFAGAMNIGVGEIDFAIPTEDDVENKTTPEPRTIQVTLLTFTAWGTNEKQTQIAIPMGHPLGDLFYTGELFMSLREMWEEWWKEHPDGTD